MSQSLFDTIVAPITGTQKAAVAWIRISGRESWVVASRVFRPWPSAVEPRKAFYGTLTSGDDGLALPFEEGHSYTGEQSVEISMHGSVTSVQMAVQACIDAGARMASPGEFTLRAFLSGRIDLTQAEAVRDTVDSLTAAQLRSANLLRNGALHQQLMTSHEAIASVLAEIEVSVDFSEEVGELDVSRVVAELRSQRDKLKDLLAGATGGRLLRHGLRIAIVGPPNAGKSSLLNALLGHERAIVTEIPGTTRDYVEEVADLGGVPCVLVDTAGLRETSDPIEAMGVERTRAQAFNADWVWYVYDGSLGWQSSDEDAVAGFGQPLLYICNKCDLGGSTSDLKVSALTGEGLTGLVELVKSRFGDIERVPLINERHEPLLAGAIEAVQLACESLSNDIPLDLASTHLQTALHRIGEITGDSVDANILDRIFHEFCIGK